MKLRIKNMVCDRCLLVVRQQLESLGLRVNELQLGEATVSPEPGEAQLLQISEALQLFGFELIDDEKKLLAERIKNIVIRQVHHEDLSGMKTNFSLLLSTALGKDYAYLSRLFSQYEGMTIEKFIIGQKVEKVKELLSYGQLNLNDIAYSMGYSSSAHLSAQFKSITGLSPSAYKLKPGIPRKPLDRI